MVFVSNHSSARLSRDPITVGYVYRERVREKHTVNYLQHNTCSKVTITICLASYSNTHTRSIPEELDILLQFTGVYLTGHTTCQ